MKKMLTVGSLILLGTLGFVFSGETTNNSASASENDKFVLFGKVDFSDDDTEEVATENSNTQTDDVDDDDEEENGFEKFIKTHKTPFSKTVHKD